MKKIKIMLLSFALLAVAGGALAFKVRFQVPLCTADVDPINFCTDGAFPITCPNRVLSTTFEAINSFCYTTPIQGRNDCKKNIGGVLFDLNCKELTTLLRAD